MMMMTMTMTYLDGRMLGATLGLRLCFSLMAVVAVAGATQAHAAPFLLGPAAFEQIYHPTPWQASLDWMTRLSDGTSEDHAAAGAKPRSPWPAHGRTARQFGSWRLARLEELVSRRAEPANSVGEPPLVRLRPTPWPSSRGSRHLDAAVFGASSRDRPITDVYDFARVESGRPARNAQRPHRSADVLNVGIRTLDYMVLTTKYLVEYISRILKNLL